MSKQLLDRLAGRRTHRKSRNGCSGCKKRHIKCDETRPECRNCIMAERVCSYLKTEPNDSSSTVSSTAAIVCTGIATPREISADRCLAIPKDPGEVYSCTGQTFTASHMAFLHYAQSNMSEFMALTGNIRPLIDTAIEHSLTAPYLLDQLLGLSSLHLSTQNGSKASMYFHQATELQTRALGFFNQTKEHISDTTYIPTFVFASLLGIHVLYETLQWHCGSLADFIDAFVNYSRLHRGVRSITGKYWDEILQSDLKPLLFIVDIMNKEPVQTPGPETKQLKEFLESIPTPSASTNVCITALEKLQWVIDLTRTQPSKFEVGVHAVMAWPLCIPDEYIEALHQHQPEAFVILAYYAAMLHRYRRFWAFGGSGAPIVHLITNSVGSFWQDVLAWPLQALIES
ncbi:hypothetical protein CaCOL14_004865 [Colletotrichum acutatum]